MEINVQFGCLHGDQAAVKDCEIEAGVEAVSQSDVAPIIQIERRFQIGMLSQFTDNLLECISTVSKKSLCRVIWSGRKVSIEIMAPFPCSVAGVGKFGREGTVSGNFCQRNVFRNMI